MSVTQMKNPSAATDGKSPEGETLNDIDIITKPSLDALIREALQASDEPETDEIAEAVLESIDPFDYTYYLREAIQHRISSAVGYLRAKSTPVIRKGVSTKQSLIRDDYWPSFLGQRIMLPDGQKFLRDATSDDLRFIAALRRTQANDLTQRAEQFETLAELMDKSRVKHLAQLDKSLGERTLGAAA